MRVLSLSQPWLWAIDSLPEPDAKRVENRSWAPPIELIDQRIALHAARSWDDDGTPYFIKLGIEHPMRRELYEKGLITSVATIDFVGTTAARFAEPQRRWFFGPYGWALVDVRRLPSPIPWRGAQGLRHLPSEVALEINRQVGP